MKENNHSFPVSTLASEHEEGGKANKKRSLSILSNNSHSKKFQRKTLPPYGYAVKQALAKDSNRVIWIRYGNDGWTHCALESFYFSLPPPLPTKS